MAICAASAVNKLKANTSPTDLVQSSGASAVPISVSASANEVFIDSSLNFQVANCQVRVSSANLAATRNPKLGTQLVGRDTLNLGFNWLRLYCSNAHCMERA